MYYINGDVYEGEWVDGEREGNGETVYASGINEKYIGEWKNDMCNGYGKYYSGIKAIADGQWHDNNFIMGKV